ncbi:response regulator [Roseibium sp. RKSG952]|uniref:response regulator n=1 Tax=Roseibium sp. RKSG952 TaxID=2529384 RepID=UPI0012BB56B6|nr:response regulator [Roseibium sp. RKSG952]MTI00212.1 response regulator [Roseibium sp. RKSG952]
MIVHIIEDDYAVADSLALLLEDFGHEVVCYPDAESFFESGPPNSQDFVVVDLGLPGVAGDEVIGWLRQLKKPPQMVAITGKPKTLLQQSKADFSSLPLLRKPLSMRVLTEYFGPGTSGAGAAA